MHLIQIVQLCLDRRLSINLNTARNIDVFMSTEFYCTCTVSQYSTNIEI